MPPFVLALRNFFPTALVLPFVAAATLWPALLLAAACFRWWDFVLPAPLFVPFAWSFAQWVGVP